MIAAILGIVTGAVTALAGFMRADLRPHASLPLAATPTLRHVTLAQKGNTYE